MCGGRGCDGVGEFVGGGGKLLSAWMTQLGRTLIAHTDLPRPLPFYKLICLRLASFLCEIELLLEILLRHPDTGPGKCSPTLPQNTFKRLFMYNYRIKWELFC